MTIAEELAAFATGKSSADLPSRAIDYSAMLIANTIASASLGSTLESAHIINALELRRGGTTEATIWFGGGKKLPVVAAARINALMSDAAASDDSDLRNITHPGTTVAACSLAVAEKLGSSGADVLTAITLGYEIAGRINTGVIPGLKEKGFHGCITAIFAGTVAVGRLLGLTQQQMVHALALAATSIGGIHASVRASTAREYHAGNAAMLGVEAALAAQDGFLAEPKIFEIPGGFFHVFGEGPTAPQVVSMNESLGKEWHILTNMGLKLLPGGHPYHSLVEAAILAAKEGDVAPGNVAKVTMSQLGTHAVPGPRYPVDLPGMAHSAAFFMASAVAYRAFPWDSLTQEKLADPVIRGLLEKVDIAPPPTKDVEKFRQGGTVAITLNDGRVFSATVHVPHGAAILGIKWDDVEAKYKTLVPASGLPAARVEASFDLIRKLVDQPDVRSLALQLQ